MDFLQRPMASKHGLSKASALQHCRLYRGRAPGEHARACSFTASESGSHTQNDVIRQPKGANASISKCRREECAS